MARKIDDTSSRQLVFAALDCMIDMPRKDAVAEIKVEFSLKPSYAATLYQQHRSTLIAKGLLVETFTVREKEGRPTIVTHYKPKSAIDGDYTTAKKALSVYKRGIEARLRACEKLQAVA